MAGEVGAPSTGPAAASATGKRGKRTTLAIVAVVVALVVVLAGYAAWSLSLGSPPKPPIHDIAVMSVAAERTSATVGDTVSISVRIENQGTVTEVTTVTVEAGTNSVGSRSVTLDIGVNQTLQFPWDTSAFSPGVYQLRAEAAAVAGETDRADNTGTGGTVTLQSPRIHDVAITSVTADKTNVQIGETVSITAVVANQGNVPESTMVTTFAGASTLGTLIAGLVVGGNSALAFTWDTTGFPAGDYPVRAEASMVAGETDTADNALTDGTVVVSATKNPGVLVIASIQDPQYLDPAIDYESQGNEVIKNVYDRLVQRQVIATDPNNPIVRNDVIVGMVANSWTVSPDEGTWNFTIRQGLTWHDPVYGTMDAYDAEYSLRRVLRINMGPAWILDQYLTNYAWDNPSTQEDERWTAINASVVATDRWHVELRLSVAYGAILQTLDYTVGSILSRRWVEDHGGIVNDMENPYVNQNTMGTGPYVLDHWTPGVELLLVKNPTYWGTPAPKLDAVLYTQVPEYAVQEQMLRDGDVDWADGIPVRDIRTVMTWPGIVVKQNAGLVIQYMGMVEDNSWPGDPLRTVNTSPFQDIHVRRAVSYAFDYDFVIQQVLSGWATQLRSGLPEGMPGWDGSFWNYRLDAAAAQAELAQASNPAWRGGFATTLSYNAANPIRAQIAVMVKAQLLSVLNIDVTLYGVSFPQHLDNMDFRRVGLYLIGWTPDYLDPDDYLRPLFHSSQCPQPVPGNPTISDAGLNASCYRNPLVDAALDNAASTSVWQYRLENYTIAQPYIVQEAAWVFMYQSAALDPIRDWVRGYYFDPMEFRDFLYLFK